MLRFLWPILALAVVFSAWSPALAAPRDPDVPLTNARHDWWVIGQNPKTTTSKCIGDPKTALCAAETVEACLIRRNQQLCEIGAGPLKIYLPDDHIIPASEKYRVNRALRLTKIPSWEKSDSGYSFRQVGDIEIELELWRCNRQFYCDDLNRGRSATFLVRWTGTQWSVAGRIECAGEPGAWGSACIGWPGL